MRRVSVLVMVLAFFIPAVIVGMSVPVAEAASKSYRSQVIDGTRSYKACKEMRSTKPGRIMYADMVSDSWDDGGKRSVRQQIRYVKQGCRNGI